MRIDENGIHLRQSDIDSFRKCPEQFRQKFHGEVEDQESDAALVGTTVHELIEHEGSGFALGKLRDAVDYAFHFYTSEIDRFEDEGIAFSRAKYRDDAAALKMLERHVTNWYQSTFRDHFLTLAGNGELLLEWEFDTPLMDHTFSDGTVTPIWVCGTSDVIHKGVEVWDWKTAGSMMQYQPWERQRWAIQPTVYTYAAWHAKLIPDPEWSFKYQVFFAGDKPGDDEAIVPRTIGVTRDHRHVDWLRETVGSMLALTETDLKVWPMRDDHALCSDKWCPVFAAGRCKGQHFDGRNW